MMVAVRSRLAVTVLCGAIVVARPAIPRAEPAGDLLSLARRQFAALELEAARETLARALATGTSAPAAVAEIHLLSGQVAAILDDRAAAIAHFRALLALSPDARLPDGVAPKISGPFAAARAKGGVLRVRAQTGVDRVA